MKKSKEKERKMATRKALKGCVESREFERYLLACDVFIGRFTLSPTFEYGENREFLKFKKEKCLDKALEAGDGEV